MARILKGEKAPDLVTNEDELQLSSELILHHS
jgi:hypothetical protein